MTEVLYLTRNGLLEPLGQSQVFSYLHGLAGEHDITLITFEKAKDWADLKAMHKARALCEADGINWLPQRFHHRPRMLASGMDILQMYRVARQCLRQQSVALVHARSYIPALVAWKLYRRTGVPFIFDMRSIWPEELIEAGRLQRGSVVHRFLEWGERTCLQDAAAVISLTHAAVDYLQEKYPHIPLRSKTTVIPTCADLERFHPPVSRPGRKIIGCLGTLLSGWFRIDWLAAFLRAYAAHDPHVHFQLTTRDDPAAVRQALDLPAEVMNRVEIAPARMEAVPDIIRQQMASVMFFSTGPAKIGSCPTRMGEVLGCGKPVVANEGVGDVAQIIRKYRVGVLVNSNRPAEMQHAVLELEKLCTDPHLPKRCRQAAEAVFSLRHGIDRYAAVYRSILCK